MLRVEVGHGDDRIGLRQVREHLEHARFSFPEGDARPMRNQTFRKRALEHLDHVVVFRRDEVLLRRENAGIVFGGHLGTAVRIERLEGNPRRLERPDEVADRFTVAVFHRQGRDDRDPAPRLHAAVLSCIREEFAPISHVLGADAQIGQHSTPSPDAKFAQVCGRCVVHRFVMEMGAK